MPTLLVPLALIGLASLPALAAIYWLRNRYRRRVVSTLMLWEQMAQAREGGRRIHRLQTPLLLLLELIALLMLVVAATEPHAQLGAGTIALTVVLDDSISMLGPSGEDAERSAREAAMEALGDELDAARYSVRLVTAGAEPRIVGDRAADRTEIERQLGLWRCAQRTADLPAAVALASELAGPVGRVLVLTDHEPPVEPASGRVVWRSFGRSAGNVAFVGAARQAGLADGDEQRCLLEIANLSGEAERRTLTLRARFAPGDEGAVLRTWDLELEPGERRPLVFSVPADAPALHASLDVAGPGDAGARDGLGDDDAVVLVPPQRRSVAVFVAIGDEEAADQVRRAVGVVAVAEAGGVDAPLVITDQDARASNPDGWTLRLMREDPAASYTGPYVMDLAHPLTEGIDLGGVIWGAGEQESVGGWPVIAVGNQVLLSDSTSADGRHDLRMRYRADLSTLAMSPNWPILFENLIRWRASMMPGVDRANIRLGEAADLAVGRGVTSVELIDPSGVERSIPAAERALTIPLDGAGVWRVRWRVTQTAEDVAGDEGTTPTPPVEPVAEERSIAVNFLDAAESDLTARSAGSWGDWRDSPVFTWEYHSIAWVFGLIALAALATHLALVSRSSGFAGPASDAADGEGGRV